jgi:signal-transduction protein with cAMP-binding, CBS, and nucleotidyltransferase domain
MSLKKILQIIKAGSIGDCMFFIASGTVCVTTTNGKELCHLEDGDFFGEVALISKSRKVINILTYYATVSVKF